MRSTSEAVDGDLIVRHTRKPDLHPTMFVGETGDLAMPRLPWDNRLDGPNGVALHLSLLGSWRRELDIQASWRADMEQDEAIYDGTGHWTREEVQALMDRGQVPLVFNITFNAVNWLLGDQRRNPVDTKILPRHEHGAKAAEAKSKLLKYLSDVDDFALTESDAYAETVKAGLSWLETGARDETEGEIVYQRYESWRNVLHDSAAQERDLSDGRFMFRAKWLDLDRAAAMFPERRHILYQGSNQILDALSYVDDGMGDNAMDAHEMRGDGLGLSLSRLYPGRRRVRLYEGWYRRPCPTKVIKGGEFSGEIYEPGTERHEWAIQEPRGRAQIVTVTKERMFVALFCDAGLLWRGLSPYRHNSFPFTPVWGYRRASDRGPYGLIRQIRDIQKDLNKRASKSLWHANARRVTVEEGAVDDIEQLRHEAGRADAVIVHKPGTRPPLIETDVQHAAVQLDMMSKDAEMIERTSGITGENMGRPVNPEQSGKAIIARQDQGVLATNIFPENLRHARKIHGMKALSNIEQFYTAEKVFRITNERGRPEFVAINTADPEVDDYIARTRADFVVAEQDYRATHRQANLEALMEVVGLLSSANPALASGILDLLIEAMDVPKKDEIVKRVRQITGTQDPDADPNNPDPEAEAIAAKKAEQEELMRRGAEAEIATKEATAAHKMAQATKTLADTDTARDNLVAAQITKIGSALTVAAEMGGFPALAAAAEKILVLAHAMAGEANAANTNLPPQATVAA